MNLYYSEIAGSFLSLLKKASENPDIFRYHSPDYKENQIQYFMDTDTYKMKLTDLGSEAWYELSFNGTSYYMKQSSAGFEFDDEIGSAEDYLALLAIFEYAFINRIKL